MTIQNSASAVPQIAGSKPMTAQRSTKAVLRMQAMNGRKEDKLLFEILGKEISVFYNDTANTVSFKEGKFFDFDSFSLMVIENSNSRPTIIPRGKCIRIEQSNSEIAEVAGNEPLVPKQKLSRQIPTGGAKIAAATR